MLFVQPKKKKRTAGNGKYPLSKGKSSEPNLHFLGFHVCIPSVKLKRLKMDGLKTSFNLGRPVLHPGSVDIQ